MEKISNGTIDFQNGCLSVRVVDDASKRKSLEHLESHLRNGVLSLNERRKLGINDHLSVSGVFRMHTAPHEISVYTFPAFRVWRQVLGYNLGVIIDAPLSVSEEKVDHFVIKDSIPVVERKIIGVYADIERIEINAIINILRKTTTYPLFDKKLRSVEY